MVIHYLCQLTTYRQLLIQNKENSGKIKAQGLFIEELSQLIDSLKFEITNLKKLLFGAKRERFMGNETDSSQDGLFDIEDLEVSQPEKPTTKTVEVKKIRKPKTFKRNSFPAHSHLPREEQIIEPADVKADDPNYSKIGKSVTEILKYHPTRLTVKKIMRPKYVKKDDEAAGVKQAAAPPSIVDESLIVGAITEKILHHTPVRRFNKKLKQAGFSFLSDSNLYICFHRGADELLPFQEQIRKDMLALYYNQMDETTITLAKNKKNDSYRGYMWMMYYPSLKAVLFNYYKQLSHKECKQLREQKALAILTELKTWFDDNLKNGKVLLKSALGKAITYSLEHWKGLCAYADNGALEIDNNLVENTIRPVALGRKNYLFAGSRKGAESLACLYTIIGTAKQYILNIQNYLTWLFKKIAAEKITDVNIKSWLPYNLSREDTEVLRL